MARDLDTTPGDMPMACIPGEPMCAPTLCGQLKGPDGCGAEVSYTCECGDGLECDEGICREQGECVLSTDDRKVLCTSGGVECMPLNVVDKCEDPTMIDCSIVCGSDGSCVNGACCTPLRVSDAGLNRSVCQSGLSGERCRLQDDVDLGCGMAGVVDCGECSDSSAFCDFGVCVVPECQVGAQCGFISLTSGELLACGSNAGTCSDSELCESYQCVPNIEVSVPNPGQSPTMFGYAVALDGDWLVVGAPLGNNGQGAVHVFQRNPLTRAMQYIKTLTSPTPMTNEFFGASVDIDGEWIAVGAPGILRMSADAMDSDPSSEGSVYMFEKGGSNWDMGVPLDRAALTLPADSVLGAFGYDVALDGDTVLVGSPLRRGPGLGKEEVGGVFVYETSIQGRQWGSAQELSYPGLDDLRLGFSVGFHGDRAVAGAPELSNRVGALYTWSRASPRTWSSSPGIVRRTGNAGAFFGYDVAVNQSYAYVGEPDKEGGAPNNNEGVGAIYRADFSPALSNAFVPFPDLNEGYFGAALAVDDRTFVVGAPGFNVFGVTAAASSVQSKVIIRALGGDGLPTTNARTLTLSDADERWTGIALDLEDGLVVVGSPHRTTEASSSVYILKGF